MKQLFYTFFIFSVVFSLNSFSANSSKLAGNTTLDFETGKAELSVSAKNQLNNLVKQAQNEGGSISLQLAAWSDNPAPAKGKELSKDDRNLADKRVSAVKMYLEDNLKVRDIETYNMAKRANWISRAFKADDAEMKTEVVQSGDRQLSKEEFQVFKDQGKASSVGVIALKK